MRKSPKKILAVLRGSLTRKATASRANVRWLIIFWWVLHPSHADCWISCNSSSLFYRCAAAAVSTHLSLLLFWVNMTIYNMCDLLRSMLGDGGNDLLMAMTFSFFLSRIDESKLNWTRLACERLARVGVQQSTLQLIIGNDKPRNGIGSRRSLNSLQESEPSVCVWLLQMRNDFLSLFCFSSLLVGWLLLNITLFFHFISITHWRERVWFVRWQSVCSSRTPSTAAPSDSRLETVWDFFIYFCGSINSQF